MRNLPLVLLLLVLLVFPACQMNERLSGTAFGGGGGAILGAVVSGAGGAVVGGLGGALAGYLVGDYLADRRERGRTEVFADAENAPAPSPAPAVAGLKVAAENDAARAAYQRGRAALTAPEARRHFEESIRLDPSRPEPYNALALNALYRGQRSEAERLFEEALQRDPSYYPARHNLAKLRGGR